MQLHPERIEITVDDGGSSAPCPGAGAVSVGALEVAVESGGGGPGAIGSIANRSDRPVRVRSVALVFRVDGVTGPLRMFRNGYQSWSPTGVATFGVDVDPSTRADFEFLQAVHHADQRRALDGELRSEWVTVLADASGGAPVLVGWDAGHDHDGTLRLRAGTDGPELWAEAFFGEAVLAPGEVRALHGLGVATGADASDLLGGWAARVGRANGARVSAPYQVGWCSWYHYFHGITEDALRSNLARNQDWPFEVFQLDDGFQSAIGDWLTTNDKFPSSIDRIAADIAAAGRTPGLWIAPFLVAPDSQVATAHPEWLAQHDGESGRAPLRPWWNPMWEGGANGFMYGLDTTHPEVLDHLEGVARSLVEAGYRYLKLDFTFSPSVEGVYHDPSRTPAQRVRAGYEAVRRGAGDDVFILGCGVPLANVLGVVDGNRIGQDVAPHWEHTSEVIPGYRRVEPATQFAYGNTVTRSFMHRRLWLNDPDCVMLRASETDLSPEAARTWARAVGISGGMALVSDDLALLGDDARALLDETLAIGRASDAEAVAGRPARCADLLDHEVPGHFSAAGYALEVDTATGASTFTVPATS